MVFLPQKCSATNALCTRRLNILLNCVCIFSICLDEEINAMRRELDKYGIQMPAFSKIGGILANEVCSFFRHMEHMLIWGVVHLGCTSSEVLFI